MNFSRTLSILVVDDEPNIRKTLGIALESEGHYVFAVANPKDALAEAAGRYFDLALVDLRLGSQSGLDLIANLVSLCPWIKCVVITAYASIDTAVEAMRKGAFDYLPKPFSNEQLSIILGKVFDIRTLEQKVASLQEILKEVLPEAVVESKSPAMQRALALARQVADSDATVLIRGESGTGKTILARALHSWSRRAAKPFGPISCPSLSSELLESELFGHARGAFTGALRDYPGRIAACEGGTLFLDEIGDLSLPIQAKLLRVLQEKAYERLGELKTRKANVRIITATNIELESAILEGRFREDLFYRLDVVSIVVPPLRERREDIPALSEALLAFFARQNHRKILGFSKDACQVLENYEWPGNVRELRNAVERSVLLCSGPTVEIHHLPLKLKSVEREPEPGDFVTMQELERSHIRRILASSRSIEDACRILGMDSVTFWRKRKKYGL